MNEQGYTCDCKEHYMGNKCEKPRDACLSNYNSDEPNGVDACGDHGECEGHPGTNVYSCKCERGWTDDPNRPYKDCALKMDACANLICRNGHCR